MPTVQTNGIKTYYERRGDAPFIVFIHGAIMDHRMWATQMERLTAAREYLAGLSPAKIEAKDGWCEQRCTGG